MAHTDPRLFPRAAALALFIAFTAQAEVSLPALLTDHMVIQRGLPPHIWGRAAPGERVSVAFRGETRTAVTDPLGRFSVYLSPGDAGGPFELTVKASNAIVLKDILVGDVWIAAGQSNMEWPVRLAASPAAEIAAASHPRIRLYQAMHRVSEFALEDIYGKPWTAVTPASIAGFSAVAYHFGRALHEKTSVPIGLVQIAWGGTPIESWISPGATASDPALMPVFAEWARMMEKHPDALLRYHQECVAWDAAAARAKAAGKRYTEANPIRPLGPASPWKPGSIFNAMVAPATRFPIRGAIWYQGESNTAAERAPLYSRLFRAMILDWRRAWAQGDFPFLFVQLAGYTAAPDSMWPEVREAQRQALALVNTAMTVALDLGEADDIHPKNKRDVGLRLSLAARALAYGESIVHSGPLFRRAAPEGAAMRVWFDHAAGGLASGGGPLKGFEVAGADGVFVPAAAVIDGSTVLASSPAVPAPLYVRYAWKDLPEANLFNDARLPASPFRSE